MSVEQRPRVAVIATGGTIASRGVDSLELLGYIERKQHDRVEELLARFPETARFAELIPIGDASFASQAIGPRQWLALNDRVHGVAREHGDLDGIVITHGTATLEETAYFLDLTVKLHCPVVLVGSQRPATALGTDAGMNLVNAIRVAGSAPARGRGVLVVLNDEIHGARDVTKTSTLKLHTFRSGDFGALGHADADRVVFYRARERRHAPDTAFDAKGLSDLPRVDIVLSYAGADGSLIRAAVAAGAAGIVTAGFAPGVGTPGELEALNAAVRQGVVVAQSSRVGSGRVAALGTAQPEGCVTTDNLTPQKARVLLMLALVQTRDRAAIQAMYDSH